MTDSLEDLGVSMRGLLTRRPGLAFFALALLFSWVVWVPAFTLTGDSVVHTVALVAGSFGPAAAGAALTKAEGRSLRAWLGEMAVWRVPARWYLAAFGLPVLLGVLLGAGYLALGGPLDLSTLSRRLVTWLPAMLFVLVAGGGNEEPGWRGYALPKLQERYSALTASLAIGVVWACWHLPLFAFSIADYGSNPFVLYLPLVVATAVGFTWLYNSTRGSVLLAMILHAGFNTATVLVPASREAFQSFVAWDYPIKARLLVVGLFAVLLVARYGPETLSGAGKRTGGDPSDSEGDEGQTRPATTASAGDD